MAPASSVRRLARGFALAYVVAGIGLSVGVGYLATSAVLSLLQSSQAVRAQGETLNSFNTIAKALSQLAVDEDGDGLVEIRVSSFNDSEGSLVGGGAVPADQVGILNDGWGRPVTLCAWDFGDVAGFGFETPYGPRLPLSELPQTAPLFALISGGPDKVRSTSCLQARNNQPQNDDIVRTVSIGEVQKSRNLGIEECEGENEYNAYNPQTGKFECKTLVFTPDSGGLNIDCPVGQIYNGEACVVPAAPDQVYESQRYATLFVQRENNNTASPSQHYRSLDLKNGVAALAYENNKVYSWTRNFHDGTWVPGKIFEVDNGGFLGSHVRIASNKGGPIKYKPQILIAETFANGLGAIYQYHLFNTMTRSALIVSETQKDFGFVDSLDAAVQAVPQLSEMSDFELFGFWPHRKINTITGVHQPSAMALHEEHTPQSFKAVLAVGNALHDSGKGRMFIYEQTNANLNQFILKQQIPAPSGSAAHQLFGRALDLNGQWMAAKSLPTQAGVATAGRTYFYKRNPDGSWPSQPTHTRPLDVPEAIEQRYLEIPVPSETVVADELAYQHKIENIAVGDGYIAIGEPINSRVPEARAGGANKSAVNAGAVVIYTYTAGVGGLPPGWYPRQTIYSPYRGTTVGTGAGQSNPAYNFFGQFIDMEGDYLVIAEPFYTSNIQEDNFDHSYVGLVYLYKNQDALPSPAVWPESNWAPVHVFAKHLEPMGTSGFNGSLVRKYIMSPVAVDGETGEVAFLQVFDIWGSTAAEGCDGSDPSCSNVVRYLSIYGPYRENEAFFVHGDTPNVETCPNRHGAFKGTLQGTIAPTPITQFGLTRAANCFNGYTDAVSGLSFSPYNWRAQVWE
jgi:hypothetical protein